MRLSSRAETTHNRRFGEMANCLFDTYKNSVMPHGKYMFQTASDMAMAKMCSYPTSKYALPHWKYILRCCKK